jgi:hypothetical protein
MAVSAIEPLGIGVNQSGWLYDCSQQKNPKPQLVGVSAIEPPFSGPGGSIISTGRVLCVETTFCSRHSGHQLKTEYYKVSVQLARDGQHINSDCFPTCTTTQSSSMRSGRIFIRSISRFEKGRESCGSVNAGRSRPGPFQVLRCNALLQEKR